MVERWQEFRDSGRLMLTEHRPTIPLETYARLMVLKQAYRCGDRTLVAEVSDSMLLRLFRGSLSRSACRTSGRAASSPGGSASR